MVVDQSNKEEEKGIDTSSSAIKLHEASSLKFKGKFHILIFKGASNKLH